MVERTSKRLHLSIFHTNDMYGRLEAMARLSGFARRLRAEARAQGRITSQVEHARRQYNHTENNHAKQG